jgi:pimeloyl-ACP methyl ester carboxylesterase
VRQALRLAQSSLRESSRTRRIALSGYRECGPYWFARVLPRMLRYPVEERMAAVQASVLMIRGEHDSVAPRAWVDQLVTAAGDGRTVEIAGAAHAVIYDHEQEVAALVLEHLGR